MRAMFRRRPAPVRAALTLLIGAALLCLLFVPARDDSNLRFALDWRPEIEPLLLIGLLALLALAGRRLSGWFRWILAALIVLAAAWQFADAMMLSVFDRELNLYLDLPHVPNLVALFYDAAGPWRGATEVAGVVLGAVVAVAVIAAALGALEQALKPRAHARSCLGVVAVALLLAPLPLASGQTLLGARTAPTLAHQAALLYRSWAVMHGYDRRYAAALAAPEPPLGPLNGLKRRDVYIVFFESYGTVVLDDPRYAAKIAPALVEFQATVEQAGYHLLSSRILSPTFGGGSWLAHGSIESGLKLDQFLARLITRSKRHTLARYMAAAGYRTIEVAPGLKTPAPDGDFWGFDQHYFAGDLGYAGPPFGWFDIPDQYTLRRFDATAAAAGGRSPLFAQIVLVSSHTPFVPVPPYVADWSDAGDYQSVTPEAWKRIYAAPDWSALGEPYVASVVYDLETLGAWLARRDGDALVVILGDHQPPGFISGEKQPWTVPIHVLSRDPDLIWPFAAAGYAEGAVPPRSGDFKGMESFLGDFLKAFANQEAALAAPGTPEHSSD
jgi:hypothetical protein